MVEGKSSISNYLTFHIASFQSETSTLDQLGFAKLLLSFYDDIKQVSTSGLSQ